MRLAQNSPLPLIITVAGALSVGALAAISPLAGLGAGGLLVTGYVLSLGQRFSQFFLLMFAFGLLGYAFLARGFAHLGFSPVYYGELLLVIGVIAVLFSLRNVKFNLHHALLVLFMIFGLLHTVPFVGEYGVDALRDAVIWAYAFFALAISLLIRKEHVETVVRWFGKILPVFVIWVPIALAAAVFFDGLWIIPGTDVPLLTSRPGEWATHLAAVGAFLILGLWSRNTNRSMISEIVIWCIWAVGVALATSMNRGSLLAIGLGVGLAIMLRPGRQLATAIIAAVLLLSSVVLVDPVVELGDHHRELSVDQLARNLQSVVGSGDDSNYLNTTRTWRLEWWNDIIDYTVFGQYRWVGKGFGVNLATDDGYQTRDDHGLRSPHNGNLTVLARMGVPGFLIWVAILGTWTISLAVAGYRSLQRGDTFWFQVSAWLLAYWAAMMVNLTFEVYLEGPQGGIWFWAVIGFGIAVIGIQNQRAKEAAEGTDVARDAEDWKTPVVRPPTSS